MSVGVVRVCLRAKPRAQEVNLHGLSTLSFMSRCMARVRAGPTSHRLDRQLSSALPEADRPGKNRRQNQQACGRDVRTAD
jgi:hypothetical protein